MHSGTNAYFNKLNEIIAGLEAAGAVVCYEGIRPAAEEEWARAAGGERAARGLSVPVSGLQAVCCRYLGWVEQSAEYSPSWCNVDMTELELVRQAQPHNISEMSDRFSDLFAGLTPEQIGEIAGSGEALLVRLMSLDYFDLLRRLSLRAASSDAHRNVDRVMVEERNRGHGRRTQSRRACPAAVGRGCRPAVGKRPPAGAGRGPERGGVPATEHRVGARRRTARRLAQPEGLLEVAAMIGRRRQK
jgi:hypothetical protein